MRSRPKTRRAATRRGIALLITLIFLALFACLAVAIATSADANLTMARNRIEAQQAAALAEAGIQLSLRYLAGLHVLDTHEAADLHEAMAEHLEAEWVSSSMLQASAITWNSTGVSVPAISVSRPDGRVGQIELALAATGGAADNTTVTIQSTGRFGRAVRTATYNMTAQRSTSLLFQHGIASRSSIQMTGNARIQGTNDPSEGSILSASYSTTDPIQLSGNASISGDVKVCNPDGRIQKTGNASIGGDEIIGAEEAEWPSVDTSLFRPYATNVRTSGASGNVTLSNVRIPAGTNPTFSSNVTIYGVLYIESPNKVTFSGNANIVGVVVAEPPAVDNLNANQIQFTGNVSASSVENLPSDSQYDGLRDLTGSFLLAPGYSAKFSGNFNTVNGCMVASEFQFAGNASGTIGGGILNLRDSSIKLAGDAVLSIDRENMAENPAGLINPYRLVGVSGSYAE